MRIFNNIDEAKESLEKKVLLERGDEENITAHLNKYDFIDSKVKVGQFFLYEKFTLSNDSMSYPKVAIYLNSLMCDQALEIEYVDCRRTIEYNTEFRIKTKNSKSDLEFYEMDLYDCQSEIQRTILWDDEITVYGSWDSIPDYTTLKQAYERTWYFYRSIDEIRDIQINRLLI